MNPHQYPIAKLTAALLEAGAEPLELAKLHAAMVSACVHRNAVLTGQSVAEMDAMLDHYIAAMRSSMAAVQAQGKVRS